MSSVSKTTNAMAEIKMVMLSSGRKASIFTEAANVTRGVDIFKVFHTLRLAGLTEHDHAVLRRLRFTFLHTVIGDVTQLVGVASHCGRKRDDFQLFATRFVQNDCAFAGGQLSRQAGIHTKQHRTVKNRRMSILRILKLNAAGQAESLRGKFRAHGLTARNCDTHSPKAARFTEDMFGEIVAAIRKRADDMRMRLLKEACDAFSGRFCNRQNLALALSEPDGCTALPFLQTLYPVRI
jgi:hypothetical protein